ncbi:hypothetical protein [Sutcliffiella sp. NC1]|uniref:hypothetical protein n=1 Tax=Sutcliffiella sp. NC1 TaxID=3004096 RepID=UPI0022DDB6FC|nr:hypothetical protein [Sutcliffiella sp. NC1]WBL17075.1 hypothetical protein O1A01_10755 [Sutcliffiella sp. NC1]
MNNRMIEKIRNLIVFMVITILLVGCQPNENIVIPDISVNDEEFPYIIHKNYNNVSNPDAPPPFHHEIEPIKVAPNTRVDVVYVDEEPNHLGWKQWHGEVLIVDEDFVGDHFFAPSREGIYIYSIESRWTWKEDIAAVFILQVEN